MNKQLKLTGLLLSSALLATSYSAFAGGYGNSDSETNTEVNTNLDNAYESHHSQVDSSPEANKMEAKKDDSMIGKISNEMTDAKIATILLGKLAGDSLVSVFAIDVEVKNGSVALQGDIDTDLQYERALIIAHSIDGVKDVNGSGLKIAKSEKPAHDIALTAHVKANIAKTKLFSEEDSIHWPVNIETKNGTVYITGEVDNEKSREALLDSINQIEQVENVKSDIIVKTQ